MWAVLASLLLPGASADWLQIAQPRPSHLPSLSKPFTFNNIYANQTAAEHPWRRTGLTRITNFGSVKRVQLQSEERDKFTVGVLSNVSRDGHHEFGTVRAPNVKVRGIEFGSDEIRSNTGDITRNNFIYDKSSINNPFSRFKVGTEKSSNNHNEFQENIGSNEKENFEEIRLNHNGDLKTGGQKNINIKRVQSAPENGITKAVQVKQIEEPIKPKFKYSTNMGSNFNKKISNESLFHTTEIFFEDTSQETSPRSPFPSNPVIKYLEKHDIGKNAGMRIRIESHNQNIIENRQHEVKDVTKDRSLNTDQAETKNRTVLNRKPKTNSIQVIWKLVQVVTDNISRNTRRSFRSKIRYLESLRNDIMENIVERLEEAWPDEAAGARRRRAARGHVDFPSSESALMTISFLTFAVFLIKLVLQVIHTYKNKTMLVTPAVVAAVGRAAAALRDVSQHSTN